MRKIIFNKKGALMALAALLVLSCTDENDFKKDTQITNAINLKPQRTNSNMTWTQVWSDEFNTIDASKWWFRTDAEANGLCYYKTANATISNGILYITAKKESYGGKNYTSARMESNNMYSFTYGRVECRMKIPQGQGLWPALWACGDNIENVGWPACGEIDIAEAINAEGFFHTTLHYADGTQTGNRGPSVSNDFHIVAMEWSPCDMKFYLDGQLYMQIDTYSRLEFKLPQYFILSMGVGGSWPGNIVDDSKLPASLCIDYLRVYSGSLVTIPDVVNKDFENGNLINGWTGWGSYYCANTGQFAGNYCGYVYGAGALEQTVSGLQPNTSYVIKAMCKVGSGTAYLGANTFGGAPISTSTSSTSYVQISTPFTTGATNTSAKIYWYSATAGQNSWVDNVTVTQIPTIFNGNFETGSLNGSWAGTGLYYCVNNSQFSGNYCGYVWAVGTLEQIVTGLQPNTTYTITAMCKVGSGTAYLGVKDFGGTEVKTPTSSTSYIQVSRSFTTGATNTSAKIYWASTTTGQNSWIDNVTIQ